MDDVIKYYTNKKLNTYTVIHVMYKKVRDIVQNRDLFEIIGNEFLNPRIMEVSVGNKIYLVKIRYNLSEESYYENNFFNIKIEKIISDEDKFFIDDRVQVKKAIFHYLVKEYV